MYKEPFLLLNPSARHMNKAKPLLMLLLVAAIIGIVSCRKTGESHADKGTAGTTAPTGEVKSILKFKTVICFDRDGMGIEAFRLLIPSDWKFSGGIRWKLDNPGMPAVAGFRVSHPSNDDEIEVFPNQGFFWTTNQMLLQMFPAGSHYFGNVVRRPMAILDALQMIAVSQFRRGAKNLRVVGSQELPGLAKSLDMRNQSQPGVSPTAHGGKLRIEYQREGVWIEEELYGVIESYTFPIQSMMGALTNTMWTLGYLFSFKSQKGKLDSCAHLFQTVVSSFRLNPQWFSKYNQVVEYLIRRQIQQIRNAGELSRIISQTHNEVSDMMMQSYNERQSVYDRVAENFSQHIRGVDEYYNPVEERPVELPSGYNHAWVNGLGEFVLTDDPTYNPNLESNQTWREMRKK